MICHTFLHVARVQKHTDMRKSHAFRVRFCVRFLHVRVFFYSRNVQNVRQNLIPRATAYLPLTPSRPIECALVSGHERPGLAQCGFEFC